MKVTCQRDKLLSAFQTVAAVAPSRSPKPILQNIKFEATADAVILMATDLEVGIRYEATGIEVQTPGSAILPVDKFGLILRESTSDTIEIEVNERGITVKGDRSEFHLSAIDAADFPPIATFEGEQSFEISARLFKELVRRTLFATDSEISRYALGGVLFEIGKEQIVAVGTDGRRLAKMEGPINTADDFTPPEGVTIIPGKAMQLMERIISDADSEIKIAIRGNSVLVKTERATIYAQLLEGRFPNWRDVFPKYDSPVRLDMVAGSLHAAVRQAAIVTSEESRGVVFNFTSGKLVLSGQAAEVGQSRIELPITYEGDDISIKLDPNFVGDFLKVLGGDRSFALELKDGDNAVLCSTDDGYSYVIMPLANDR